MLKSSSGPNPLISLGRKLLTVEDCTALATSEVPHPDDGLLALLHGFAWYLRGFHTLFAWCLHGICEYNERVGV